MGSSGPCSKMRLKTQSPSPILSAHFCLCFPPGLGGCGVGGKGCPAISTLLLKVRRFLAGFTWLTSTTSEPCDTGLLSMTLSNHCLFSCEHAGVCVFREVLTSFLPWENEPPGDCLQTCVDVRKEPSSHLLTSQSLSVFLLLSLLSLSLSPVFLSLLSF